MKISITVSGWGRDLSIGQIKDDILQYIEDNYDCADDYAYALDSGDVPEEYKLADDWDGLRNVDNLHSSSGCFLNSAIFTFMDENDEIKGEFTYAFLKKHGTQIEVSEETIDDSPKCISVFKSEDKGTYLAGTFEIEGRCNPSKLKIYCSHVNCPVADDAGIIIDSLEYDGEAIDCEFVETSGKGTYFEFLKIGNKDD